MMSPNRSINSEKSLFESLRRNGSKMGSKLGSRKGSPKIKGSPKNRKRKANRSPLKPIYYNRTGFNSKVRGGSPRLSKKKFKPVKSFFKVNKNELSNMENSLQLEDVNY
jgi:hypothetical protein